MVTANNIVPVLYMDFFSATCYNNSCKPAAACQNYTTDIHVHKKCLFVFVISKVIQLLKCHPIEENYPKIPVLAKLTNP